MITPKTLLIALLAMFLIVQIACKDEANPFEVTSATCSLTTSTMTCEDSNLFVVNIEGVAKGASNVFVFPPAEAPEIIELDCGEWTKMDENHCQRTDGQPKETTFVYTGYFRCIPSNAFFGPLEFDVRRDVPSSLFGGGAEPETLVTVNCR